ncbi:uncharacterized protein LOC142566626 [Dermacentor variabilis]|uniref:uncharacterized protein LOC142566626 n=1 Tax=Dermacentor variabilis TaxID=34621 RepID=UPI003F5B392D
MCSVGKNPRVWFMQAEVRFQLCRITSQRATYPQVVAALPSDIAVVIDDLLAGTTSATACEDLKRRVLPRIEPLQQRTLQQLLSEELGDQRPPELLHWLSQLLGGDYAIEG